MYMCRSTCTILYNEPLRAEMMHKSMLSGVCTGISTTYLVIALHSQILPVYLIGLVLITGLQKGGKAVCKSSVQSHHVKLVWYSVKRRHTVENIVRCAMRRKAPISMKKMSIFCRGTTMSQCLAALLTAAQLS